MQRYSNNILTSSNKVVPNASVQVVSYPAGTPVVIFGSNSVGDVITNPITAGRFGEFTFYVANGRYQLNISGIGISNYSVPDILFHDPEDVNYAITEDGKLSASIIPAVAFQRTWEVADLATMLELSGAVEGDSAIVASISKTFSLAGVNPAIEGNWKENLAPSSTAAIQAKAEAEIAAQYSISYSVDAMSSKNAAAGSAVSALNSAGAASTSASTASASAISANAASSAALNAKNMAVSAKNLAIQAWAASTLPAETLATIEKTIHTSSAILDSFIYDSRQDTDGGEWRKQCQHTSWFTEVTYGKWLGECATEAAARAVPNATTADYYHNTSDNEFYALNAGSGQTTVHRGMRSEFPGRALIIVELLRVTIYDLTDNSCPMWMVFKSSGDSVLAWDAQQNLRTARMVNGVLIVAGDRGLTLFNFVKDSASIYYNLEGGQQLTSDTRISRRHTAATFGVLGTPTIVDNQVRSIATYVRHDAQLNECGLPVPTIAVATDAGASVIKPDGTVVNSSSTSFFSSVSWGNDGTLFASYGAGPYHCLVVPYSDLVNGFSGQRITYSSLGTAYYSTLVSSRYNATSFSGCVSVGDNQGFGLFKISSHNPASNYQSAGMHAHITNQFNTCWMVGDIRRCFLADSVSETVTGEIISNGNFDSDSVWVNGTGWNIESGVASKSAGTASDISETIPLTPSRKYRITVTVSNYTAGTLNASLDGISEQGINISANGTHSLYRVASNETSLVFSADAAFAGSLDSVTVRALDVDRSIKQGYLDIVGSITKTAVQGGRSIYSGFSSSNYLQEASHADWNALGTGDFSILMSGVNWGTPDTTRCIFSIGDGSSTGSLAFHVNSTNELALYIYGETGFNDCYFVSTPTYTDDSEHVLEIKRRSGVLYLFVDGVSVPFSLFCLVSTPATYTVSNATGYFRIGERQDASYPWIGGGVACVRISATATSSNQSKHIAVTELALNGGAPCLLGDTATGAVQIVSTDKVTGNSYAATVNGVSAFNNLVRLSYSATSVGALKSVSAFDGSYCVCGASSASIFVPAEYNREAHEYIGRANVPRKLYIDGNGVTTYPLPLGWKPIDVRKGGLDTREGSGYDYIVTFDGFVYNLVFASAVSVGVSISVIAERVK